MIICPNCTRENENHYKFCLGCGTELDGASAAPAVEAPARTVVPQLNPLGGGKLPSLGNGAKGIGRISFIKRAVPVGASVAPSGPPPRREPSGALAAERAAERAEDWPELVALLDKRARSTQDQAARHKIQLRQASVLSTKLEREQDAIQVYQQILAEDPENDAAILGRDALLLKASMEQSANAAPPPPQVSRTPPQAGVEAPPISSGGLPPAISESALNLPPVVVERPAPPPDDSSYDLPFEPPAPGEEDDLGSVELAGEAQRLCTTCNMPVPPGFKFCGACGSRYEEPISTTSKVPTFAPNRPPASLVLIHPDGSEGTRVSLSQETAVGRHDSPAIFREDPFLSPRHATFYFVKEQLYVRDEDSLNGVFLKIKAEVEIFHGDILRIGQQLLRFEELSQGKALVGDRGDGTTVMGSPSLGVWGRLGVLVGLNTTANVWTLEKEEIFLGRERGDIVFQTDGFISGAHCKVSQRNGRFFISDLGSTNGTYLRIKGEGLLVEGDHLLLGQQLFRVELRSA